VLLDAYMKQILEDGFFHADPHPGNLFVEPGEGTDEDGNRNWRLTFIDFGMMGRVPENLRTGLQEVLIAVGTQDASRLVASFTTLDVLLPSADLQLIERASMQLFERFWGMSMSDLRTIDHSEVMRFGLQFRELMVDLPVQLPENLLLLGRTVALLSGMCTGLDPDFNLWTSISPYATKLISDEGGSTFKTVLAEATKIFQVLIGLPGRTDRVLSMLERGELNVRTPLLEMRVKQLERSVSRINGGLVFGALLIAGAVVYSTDPVFGKWLMGGSALVLAWVTIRGRGGHGRR
jgi:predicted unusual protein kinase regulating ubiquinone biosynthesis (AarF/ABC1/UbiB family)